jgi:hypothetical protein
MGIESPFNEWLPEIIDDSIVVDDDVNFEAIQNMWSFSLTSHQIRSITLNDVVEFIDAIVASRLEQIRRRRLPQMVLYFWCDEMANQLRFSMVSVKTSVKLPFGCPVNPSLGSPDIARQYLMLAASNVILWKDLSSDNDGDTSEGATSLRDGGAPNVLGVYATILSCQ